LGNENLGYPLTLIEEAPKRVCPVEVNRENKMQRILIGIATFNEAGNIQELLDQLSSTLTEAVDILVVDDQSPDGTGALVLSRKETNSRLRIDLICRPGKFGIGSAHRRILWYAIDHQYDFVLTMDADFSHRPIDVERMVQNRLSDRIVVGSRYMAGGRCEYTGYRWWVSFFGNILGRNLLRLPLKEITTSLRIWPVSILKKLPLSSISSDGYLFFVEMLHVANLSGLKIVELPIIFQDRWQNSSKIPRLQILQSFVGLMGLALKAKSVSRYLGLLQPDRCRACGGQQMRTHKISLKMTRAPSQEEESSPSFRCTSVVEQQWSPTLTTCGICGHSQSAPQVFESNLESIYKEVVDRRYIDLLEIKKRTADKAISQLGKYFREVPHGDSPQIIDIGCYYGAFLTALSNKGFSCVGVELSTDAAQFAKELSGCEVINDTIKTVSNDNRKFRLATSWDVIEHVGDLQEFLESVNRTLLKDGVFIFSTIFIDSWFARCLGTAWPWMLPMHLSYFSKHSVAYLLSRFGFELVEIKPYWHYASLGYALNGLRQSSQNRLIKCLVQGLTFFFPKNVVLPFYFGDVKIVVARKVSCC
jgi:dolichol-phosphate mannosyltransferase